MSRRSKNRPQLYQVVWCEDGEVLETYPLEFSAAYLLLNMIPSECNGVMVRKAYCHAVNKV